MARPPGSSCDERFLALLDDHWIEHVERHGDSVFGLHPDLTLGYLNPAWFRFARENGAGERIERWGLGAPILDAMHGPVRAFYEEGYRRCLSTSRIWQHDYECSSATHFREFHMDAFPLRNGHGLLVVNTLAAERPHGGDRVIALPDPALYTGPNGLILQCGYCRRVQRADGSQSWDWVPRWVQQQPENVTGGLCLPCLETRFPDLSEGQG